MFMLDTDGVTLYECYAEHVFTEQAERPAVCVTHTLRVVTGISE